MLLISYDISNDKVRTKFSKFLKQFGRRLQYSVFEIKNSQRVLNNILKEIELIYRKQFRNSDSVIIIPTCKTCDSKIYRCGWLVQEEKDVVVFE
jgi:CRISPR-associated protein Cas2